MKEKVRIRIRTRTRLNNRRSKGSQDKIGTILKHLKKHNGVAVLLVLLIVAVMTSMAVRFAYLVRSDLNMVENLGSSQRAYYLAKSGIYAAARYLRMDNPQIDHLGEYWASEPLNIAFDYGEASLKVIDGERKLGVNKVLNKNDVIDEWYQEALMRVFEMIGLEPMSVDVILDWIDKDDYPRPYGAESEYYGSLPQPYDPRNAPMLTDMELLLLKGITPEIYYPREELPCLSQLITVNSSGSININTASELVLRSMDEGITESIAQNIINYRAENPFQSPIDLKKVPGIDDRIYGNLVGRIRVFSEYFEIRSTGIVSGLERTIKAVVHRQGNQVKIIYFRVI